MRCWRIALHQCTWPRDVNEFLDYIEDRQEEPCGKTVPNSITAALAFIERKGGVPPSLKISDDPYLISQLESINLELSRADIPTRKAPRLLLKLVMSLELKVMNEGVSLYKRFIAGLRLMKSWCVMRYDDRRGLPGNKIIRRSWGLEANLLRTKTTGTGRRVLQRGVFLSNRATLTGAPWLGRWLQILDSEVLPC